MNSTLRTFVGLHVVLLIYSAASVLSKQASNYPVLSFSFLLFYGGALISLGVYALLWQKVLKVLPLTIAFANKAVVVIWGVIWGKLLYDEKISLHMIIGAIIIIAGILLVVSEPEKGEVE